MNNLLTFQVKHWVVFGITRFKPPIKVSDALINEARIVHVLNGNSRLYAANHFMDLQMGDTIVMKPDNFVNIWKENETDQENEVIAFQLNADFLKHLYNNQLPAWIQNQQNATGTSLLRVDNHLLVQAYFKTLKSYFNNKSLLNEELIQLKIRELLSLLIQTDHTGEIRNMFGSLFSTSDYDFQEVIQKNIFENLSTEELAFLAGLSLSSFKRKFKTIYGTSPNKYIISKRIEKSQMLLKSTNLTISEIAYDCGFSDVGYFSKVFKRFYNALPSDIRK